GGRSSPAARSRAQYAGTRARDRGADPTWSACRAEPSELRLHRRAGAGAGAGRRDLEAGRHHAPNVRGWTASEHRFAGGERPILGVFGGRAVSTPRVRRGSYVVALARSVRRKALARVVTVRHAAAVLTLGLAVSVGCSS